MTTDDAQLIDFGEYLAALPTSKEIHKADVLLLTCMDFRFFVLIGREMAVRRKRYDHVILAGAALGAVVEKPPKPHWRQYFFEHLDLSWRLHHIERIIIMEHRGCGAYEEFGLLRPKPDPNYERDVHKEQVEKLARLIPDVPGLPVDSFLLTLPDRVDPLTVDRLMVDRLA
jgi:carbonic anhydrase